ncbi:MAG: triacylglycerol lipase [Gammaproteobacteria bacterium]|nr:MAG: triacylglycerol lipase [Gammaproteobacteria bacterium]
MKSTSVRLAALLALFCSSLAMAGGYTQTKYPIVLVHGIFGFDKIGGLIGYFHTVPYNLRRSGATVEVANVSALNSSWERGKQLRNFINSLPYSKVNLIGHSQGSPTSRVAAHLAPWKVASVTSVDGVNKGSKVADVVRGAIKPGSFVEGGADAIANAVGGLINILAGSSNQQSGLAALETLSTKGTTELNDILGWKGVNRSSCSGASENQNIGGYNIKFFSWAGTSVITNVLDISDPFIGILSLSFKPGEPNDGLVDACSMMLGNVIGTHYSMNHLDAQNQLLGLRSLWTDPVELYRVHANRLKNKGL